MTDLRVWERPLALTGDGPIEIPLRFRVVPGIWPEIEFAPADGTPADVTAPAYELRMRCDAGGHGSVAIDVRGFHVVVPGSGERHVTLRLQEERAELTIDDEEPMLLAASAALDSVLATAVTDNIAGFALNSRPADSGWISLTGDARLFEATVSGLREAETSIYRTALQADAGPGELFYESARFAVYDGRVTEAADGDLPALVPDRTTIVSPIRVVEEFVWRDTPYGDMTRVVDRREVWRSVVEPGRFPTLRTSFRSVDAAFELALETFQRNSNAEFALPGQEGTWSAGYFQGPGLGFGSWRRDTSHIALRSGNLLDPEVARASLASVVNGGFDNGSDGDSLPAVAIWDYFLATGDESLILETWSALAETAASLDSRFDEGRRLVRAAQSTSNDLFDEPEVDGFALSTEVYTAQTYAALADMAALPGIHDPRAEGWAERARTMRGGIIEQYWNPEHGYFTSGPVGSESSARGTWETSGAEAAVWGFLGADAEPMTASVLQRMREVAMSEYGVVLFPHRDADNHFCKSVWYCWQAGIARAAARIGDAALVHELIGQQVRTVVRNKTFYEVTDAVSGESWRWPGQLWHAAGFASLVLYGVLGIRYDLVGLTFTPAVAPQFEGARLDRLRYRGCVLDIEIRGHGTRCEATLDGRPVDRIPPETTGRHTVVLAMR